MDVRTFHFRYFLFLALSVIRFTCHLGRRCRRPSNPDVNRLNPLSGNHFSRHSAPVDVPFRSHPKSLLFMNLHALETKLRLCPLPSLSLSRSLSFILSWSVGCRKVGHWAVSARPCSSLFAASHETFLSVRSLIVHFIFLFRPFHSCSRSSLSSAHLCPLNRGSSSHTHSSLFSIDSPLAFIRRLLDTFAFDTRLTLVRLRF
jgi:hypothetical protein